MPLHLGRTNRYEGGVPASIANLAAAVKDVAETARLSQLTGTNRQPCRLPLLRKGRHGLLHAEVVDHTLVLLDSAGQFVQRN